ncbi:hypothetical protein A7D27_09990 [Pseudomonas sp. 1D4]|uniref:hypothetical protein n=1 Tax=Pseudomonadaceae TaxID=135621 RepID=UPI00084B43FF|nr:MULTISPECIES: hypothetical protein [Pseudomonas]OEC43141.1 hypothetical protein A7D27_09990 [Pseudomonas sp. 1D4]OEC59459.1 hypothetical protein A9G05_11120 [Pseudomonas sp. ENNP23]
MLNELQQEQLLASLYATAEILDQQLQPRAAALMVADLKIYGEKPLVEALSALRRTGQKLTPENVIRHLVTQDGRPEANEAWAIAMTSYDEAETVLMTPEIQQAAASAESVFRAGDKIGARMAFIATYERLVTTARQVGTPLKWSLSLGHDAERRASAIESAERLGRLPAPQAQALLAHHAVGQITAEGRAIVGLLAGPSADGLLALTADEKTREALKAEAGEGKCSLDVREQLQRIRQSMAASRGQKDEERRVAKLKERRELAKKRRAALQTIQELQEQRHAQ